MKKDRKGTFSLGTLSFPVHPGEDIYYIYESEEGEDVLEKDTVVEVGVNQDGKVLVWFEGDGMGYVLGEEDRMFFTREDAERFREDPDSLPKDYGLLDKKTFLPCYPGTYYTCEEDGFERKWYIFEEEMTEVRFTKEGEVSLENEEVSCTWIGAEPSDCFQSYEEAQAFVKKHNQKGYRVVTVNKRVET